MTVADKRDRRKILLSTALSSRPHYSHIMKILAILSVLCLFIACSYEQQFCDCVAYIRAKDNIQPNANYAQDWANGLFELGWQNHTKPVMGAIIVMQV